MPKELYVFFNDSCTDYKQQLPVIKEFINENPDIVVEQFNISDMNYPPTAYHVKNYAIKYSPTYIGIVDGKVIDRVDGGQASKFVLKSLLG